MDVQNGTNRVQIERLICHPEANPRVPGGASQQSKNHRFRLNGDAPDPFHPANRFASRGNPSLSLSPQYSTDSTDLHEWHAPKTSCTPGKTPKHLRTPLAGLLP